MLDSHLSMVKTEEVVITVAFLIDFVPIEVVPVILVIVFVDLKSFCLDVHYY